jgi:hypothetical protein
VELKAFQDPIQPFQIPEPRPGYPLGLMFLAIALASVMLAMTVASLSKVDREMILGAVIGGCVLGPGLGALAGLFHGRRLWGGAIGLVAGLFVGPMLGLLIIIPPERFPRLIGLAAVGSVILLGIAALMRRNLVLGQDVWRPPSRPEVSDAGIFEAEVVEKE